MIVHFSNYFFIKIYRNYYNRALFPFSAKVNDTYYEVEAATGYTEWIDLGNVESFEFYLPSYFLTKFKIHDKINM